MKDNLFLLTRYLTVKMTCYYLSISRSRLGELMKTNSIPYLKIGNSPRFDRVELDEWIKNGKTNQIELPSIPSLKNSLRYGNN